eukprot:CAMPEP_0117611302 /NCGR_PEP_ID=MMETSP0784-20121206/82319_1 /TAXON_ID=39447 /ORGANISM="" /LENGTH=56 /DNA_ID=CAMNT_0005414733 /DNA_START=137 /DNA_END=303 /DNA_ORIENTATION=-
MAQDSNKAGWSDRQTPHCEQHRTLESLLTRYSEELLAVAQHISHAGGETWAPPTAS